MHIIDSLDLGLIARLRYKITSSQRVDPGLAIVEDVLIDSKKANITIYDQTIFKKCFVNRFWDSVEDEETHAYMRKLPKIKSV